MMQWHAHSHDGPGWSITVEPCDGKYTATVRGLGIIGYGVTPFAAAAHCALQLPPGAKALVRDPTPRPPTPPEHDPA